MIDRRMLPAAIARAIAAASGRMVFLTGAGISAESGIPTFRGSEGFWRVGSRNYHPTRLATAAAFEEMPDEIWPWYLYRRGACRAAAPNLAHHAPPPWACSCAAPPPPACPRSRRRWPQSDNGGAAASTF